MSMRLKPLVCSSLAALLLSVSVSAAAAGTAGLTGKYFGPVEQIMNSPLHNAGPIGTAPALYSMRNDQVVHGVLGFSVSPMYWLWDFDSKRILLGGAELYAMMNFHPTVRLYSPTRTRIEGEHVPVPPATATAVEQQHLATLTDNGDGTYTADFNLQIYFSPAGYPLGNVPTKFQVTRTDTGELSIITLDEAPDGRLGADGLVSDGIPGVVKFAQGEDPVLGLFPFRVSPAWESIGHRQLKPVDGALDSNGDGIPDDVALALGLNPYVLDTDGDGISDKDEIGPNWALPLDSDGDGVPDALEPGDAARDRTRIANLRLANGEFVTLTAADGEIFGAITTASPDDLHGPSEESRLGAYTGVLQPRWLGQPDRFLNLGTQTGADLLPKQDDQGQPYYNLGVLEVRQTGADHDVVKFELLEAVFAAVDNARSSYASAQQNVVERQAAYDASPTTVNYNRLQAALNRVPVAQAEQEQAEALKALRLNAKFRLPAGQPARTLRQMALDWLGTEFDNVQTQAQFLALAVLRTGVSPQNKNQKLSDKLVDLRIEFADGVPQGLRLIEVADANAVIYNHQYNGIISNPAANWTPKIYDPIAFDVLDDKTILVKTQDRGMGAVSFYNTDGTVTFSPKLSTLVLLHTQADRMPVPPQPAEPETPQQPEPETPTTPGTGEPAVPQSGSSGGGAMGGALLVVLSALPLLAQRRRKTLR